jgi:acyl-CoA synthetase (AMP-forming)/AMP-acid ligase II
LLRDSASPSGKRAGAKSLADRASSIFLLPGDGGTLKKVVVPSAALMARVRLLPVVGEANYMRALIVPGLHTPSGFCRAAVNLYAGRTGCFALTNAARLLAIKTFNIDTLVCTPDEAAGLVDFIAAGNDRAAESLDDIWIEDGAVSADLGSRIQAHLGRNVIAGYGSGEVGRVALSNFDMLAARPGAVGFVAPHATNEIVDDQDNLLRPGEAGRLRCRTEFYEEVCAASDPERRKSAWWYPGKIGRLDNDGMLCIV